MIEKKTRITPVRMTESMRARAERQADRDGVTLSKWIRRAVSEKLERR